MAILGGSYTMVKVGLQDLPVFGSLLLRSIVAVVALGGYMLWAGLPFVYRGRAAWFLFAQTFSFVSQQALLYLGLALTTAGRAAILFNMQPFFTLFLLPIIVPGERPSARRLLGTLAAFVGVILVLSEREISGGVLIGDLLVLVGAALWSSNVILNRTMPRELHPVPVIFWSLVGAVPVTAALTLLLEPDAKWNVSAAAIFSVLYLGVIAASFAFVMFVWLTRTYSPSLVNPFVFLAPIFGVLIGWAVLGEQVTVLQTAGAVAVAAGIWFVNSGK